MTKIVKSRPANDNGGAPLSVLIPIIDLLARQAVLDQLASKAANDDVPSARRDRA